MSSKQRESDTVSFSFFIIYPFLYYLSFFVLKKKCTFCFALFALVILINYMLSVSFLLFSLYMTVFSLSVTSLSVLYFFFVLTHNMHSEFDYSKATSNRHEIMVVIFLLSNFPQINSLSVLY